MAFCHGRARIIAINDAYKLAPFADVLYACDQKWYRWHAGVPSFQGLKYSLQPTAAVWPGVRVLRNTGNTGLELDPSGLRTGRNGGYQAINLAVHFGAARIILLGYDMKVAPDGRDHWFGKHPDQQRSPYASFIPQFQGLIEPLRALGVTVINASRQSALECFPRVPLEEALA